MKSPAPYQFPIHGCSAYPVLACLMASEHLGSARDKSVCLTSILLSNSSLYIPQIKRMLGEETDSHEGDFMGSTQLRYEYKAGLRGGKGVQMYWQAGGILQGKSK